MLEEVKEYLKITWNDEDSSLLSTIERGKATLCQLTGTSLDYANYLPAKSLLLDYCRYSYNNALEYFEDNFHKEILRLQLFAGIEAEVEEVVE